MILRWYGEKDWARNSDVRFAVAVFPYPGGKELENSPFYTIRNISLCKAFPKLRMNVPKNASLVKYKA
jgi:hypothetical protein